MNSREYQRLADDRRERSADDVNIEQGNPEERASLFSIFFFQWVSPILKIGNDRKHLDFDDLFPIARNDQVQPNYTKLRDLWGWQPFPTTPVWWAMYRTSADTFWASAAMLLVSSILNLLVPVLLMYLLDWIQDFETAKSGLGQGYILAISLFVGSLLKSLTEHQFWIIGVRSGMRMQGAVMAECFRKALALRPSARNQYPMGQITNLLAVDAWRISDSNLVPMLHWGTWSSLMAFIVAFSVLCRMIGPGATMVGFVVYLVCWPLGFYFGLKVKSSSEGVQHCRDLRATYIADMLGIIKVLKALQWETYAKRLVGEFRANELDKQWSRQLNSGFTDLVSQLATTMAPIAAFLYYSLYLNEDLSAGMVFSALAWFNLLQFPLQFFPITVVALMDNAVSWKRMKQFFGQLELSEEPQNLACQPDLSSKSTALSLTHASFSWAPDELPVLQSLNLTVESGNLVVLVGSVGCGKTSLLRAILGELELLPDPQSSVSVNGRIAYAGQVAWVQNLSIEDNIRFGLPLDDARLKECIKCCGLQNEVESFPNGSKMEVGDQGVNLSGGQKQRLSLARAVYSDRDIYLIDGLLAALDNTIANHVWANCIVGALASKTRLVVTHQTRFLSDKNIAKIIVLAQDGTIAAQGSFSELKKSDDSYVRRAIGFEKGRKPSEDKTSRNQRTESIEEQKVDNTEKDVRAEVAGIVQEEERGTGFIDWKSVMLYAREFGGGVCLSISLLFLFLIEQGLNVWKSVWLGVVTDNPEDKQFFYLMILAIGGGILCVITTLRVATMIYGSLAASKSLHNKVLSSILCAPCVFFDSNLQGRILNRFIGDMNSIDAIIPTLVSNLAKTALYFGSIVIMLVGFLPQMLLVMMALVVPYWKVANFYRWPARDLKRLESLSKSPVLSHFVEAVHGASTLRAYGRARDMLESHFQHVCDYFQVFWLRWIANQWVTVWLEFIGCLFTLGCALLCVWACSNGYLTSGMAGVLLTYSVMIPNQLGWILKLYTMAEVEFVSVERIGQYVNIKGEEESAEQSNHYQGEGLEMQENIQQAIKYASGELSLRDVCFEYQPNNPILKNLNMSIPAGKKVAVLGSTGAGKSSIFQVLLRFYDYQGEILLNQTNVKSISIEKHREEVTYVPQHPVLFGGCIRDAITGPKDDQITDADLWRVLERVGMKEAISQEPKGLSTPLSDLGMSAGERQLLCVARAILKPASLLLCDEMTSALDITTDKKIHEVIFSLPSTVIAICHRLHYLKNFDHVVVLDGGTIVEQGSYQELKSQPNSRMSRLISHHRAS